MSEDEQNLLTNALKKQSKNLCPNHKDDKHNLQTSSENSANESFEKFDFKESTREEFNLFNVNNPELKVSKEICNKVSDKELEVFELLPEPKEMPNNLDISKTTDIALLEYISSSLMAVSLFQPSREAEKKAEKKQK